MNRTLIIVFALLLGTVAVNADILPLDDTCSNAQHNDNDISELIDDTPTSFNCLDIYCAIVSEEGQLIKVSDGTGDAEDGTALQGRASYILTNPNMDLQDITGLCQTPAFRESYCSSRNDWNLYVGIARHYKAQNGGTTSIDDDLWSSYFIEKPGRLSNSLHVEGNMRILSNAYTCEDTQPPQLLHHDGFDMETGIRTVRLLFSDNETAYRTEYGASPVSLLLEYHEDDTTLRTCEYGIGTEGGPDEWDEIDCQGEMEVRETLTLHPDEHGTSGVWLWMKAEDSQGNEHTKGIPLEDYYEAFGQAADGGPQGYCPQQNRCFVDKDGNKTADTFEEYISAYYSSEQSVIPACVRAGTTVDDYYCTSEFGLIRRSEALLSYGRWLLVDPNENGVVYCGDTNRIMNTDSANTPCGTNNEYDPECTLACVVSHDIVRTDSNEDNWQFVRAIFASNNYLRGLEEPAVHVPEAFADMLISRTDRPSYLDVSRSCNEGPTSHGSYLECSYNTRINVPADAGLSDITLTYNDRTGLGTIRQGGISINLAPNHNRIAGAIGELPTEGLVSHLNTYLNDIIIDYEPQYDTTVLNGLTGVSAYRIADGREILAVSAHMDGVTLRTSEGVEAHSDVYVVGVVYTGFSDTDYLRQSLRAMRTVDAIPVRTVSAPTPYTTEDDEDLYVFATTGTRNDAHTLIEQLVVRLRPE